VNDTRIPIIPWYVICQHIARYTVFAFVTYASTRVDGYNIVGTQALDLEMIILVNVAANPAMLSSSR